MSRDWRQFEDVQIEGTPDGRFICRVEGREYAYPDVGGLWPDADNLVGDRGRLSFVQGNPLLPVFFSRKSKPERLRRIVDTLETQEELLPPALDWAREIVSVYPSWVAPGTQSPIDLGEVTE